MERIIASWLASAVTYSDRLKAGLLPRFPEMVGFLDPHNLGAICVANVAYLAVVYLCVQRVKANGPFSDSLLKPFMMFYNASCVALAGAVVFGIVRHNVRRGSFPIFGPQGTFACNAPELGTADGELLAWYVWLYYVRS